MDRTPFAGLTRLSPADSLSTDGASFQSRNPSLTDRLLEIGAVTHRHDAHAALANPTAEPSGSVVSTGGTIPSDLAVYLGYTLRDDDAGETALSDVAVVSTGSPVDPPSSGPVGEIDYGGGALLADTYYYAITLLDGAGGQTPLSPWVAVEREPGYASGQVNLSGLTADFGSGAVAWRLFRARGGTEFDLLVEGDTDTFTDDGSYMADCSVQPPGESNNSTNSSNSIYVTVPSGGIMDDASSFRLYASLDGGFLSGSLIGEYPAASAGIPILLEALNVSFDRPPTVSTCVPGASLIDPDTDLLDWHWKRPVAASGALGSGSMGDVRLSNGDGTLYAVLRAEGASAATHWTALGSAGIGVGEGGSGLVFASAVGGNTVLEPNALVFEGSGGTTVEVDDDGGIAHVTITSIPGSPGAPGADGAPGASGAPGAPGAPGADGDDGAPGATGPPGPGAALTVADVDSAVFGASGIFFSGLAAGSGVTVIVEENPNGSATVHIGASAAVGPQGDQGIPGEDGEDGAPGAPGAPGASGANGTNGTNGSPGAAGVNARELAAADLDTILLNRSQLQFEGSASVEEQGGGSALVSFRHDRHHASATIAGLASGASAATGLDVGFGYRLYKIRANKSARVEIYGASAYQTADAGRAIGTDPTGDHGVILDFVMPAVGSGSSKLDWTLSPMVDGANVEPVPIPVAPVRITNMASTGDITVSFIYVRTE